MPPGGGRVEGPLGHRAAERDAFDEFVPGHRVDATLRHAVEAVLRPAHPLKEGVDATRRTDLADEVDGSDVDAELERRRRHDGAQLPRPQAGLDGEATFHCHAPVVGRDGVLAELGAQQVREPLGHLPGVDEDEGRPVAADEVGERVHDLVELFGRHHSAELVGGEHDAEVEPALVADVDDGTARGPIGVRAFLARADEQAGDALDRALRGRAADARRTAPAVAGDEPVEPFEAEGEVRPALVAGERVDLVDDDRADRAEHLPTASRGDEQVERLGGRDDDVGWPAEHRGARRGRGVAVADRDAERPHVVTDLLADRADRRERRLEVLRHVDGERAQRRDVEDRGRRTGPGRGPVAQATVDGDEEGGERLARAGRRGDEGVLAAGDRRPAERLGGGGAGGEAATEPLRDRRMERVEGRAGGHETRFYGGLPLIERTFVITGWDRRIQTRCSRRSSTGVGHQRSANRQERPAAVGQPDDGAGTDSSARGQTTSTAASIARRTSGGAANGGRGSAAAGVPLTGARCRACASAGPRVWSPASRDCGRAPGGSRRDR